MLDLLTKAVHLKITHVLSLGTSSTKTWNPHHSQTPPKRRAKSDENPTKRLNDQ